MTGTETVPETSASSSSVLSHRESFRSYTTTLKHGRKAWTFHVLLIRNGSLSLKEKCPRPKSLLHNVAMLQRHVEQI